MSPIDLMFLTLIVAAVAGGIAGFVASYRHEAWLAVEYERDRISR